MSWYNEDLNIPRSPLQGPTKRELQAKRKAELRNTIRQMANLESKSKLKPKETHRLGELKSLRERLEAHIKVEDRILKREYEEKIQGERFDGFDDNLQKSNEEVKAINEGRNIYLRGY